MEYYKFEKMLDRKIIFVLFLSLFHFSVKAQKQELRTLYLQQISLDADWSTTFDGGYYKGLTNANYTRWGIRNVTKYRLNGTLVLDAGFMYNRVDRYENGVENEFRPHQSLHVAYPRFENMTIKHRFRMEEQFYTHSYNDKTDFATRLRYAVSTQRAIDFKKRIEPNTLYWKASGELSFNFIGRLIEEDKHFFQRGRYGLGLGYQFNSKMSIEGMVYYQRTYSNASFHEYSDLTIYNFYLKRRVFWQKKKKKVVSPT